MRVFKGGGEVEAGPPGSGDSSAVLLGQYAGHDGQELVPGGVGVGREVGGEVQGHRDQQTVGQELGARGRGGSARRAGVLSRWGRSPSR